jgi:TolB-like protein
MEILRFGNVVLDVDRALLRDSKGAEVALRPKSLDFLLELARNAGRILSPSELFNAVWPDVTVTTDSIAQCVLEVRRAIGDPEGRILRTVVKRGYCLDVKVQSETSTVTTARTPAIPTEQDRPSLVVLPFQSFPEDPKSDWFADGMVEEITTALSRFRSLFVIARNSAFTFKGQNVDVREVGQRLGVRYVLEGSVRRVGEQVRVTGQLVESESGAHVWADRFDGALHDVFKLQDQITTAVAGVLEPRIHHAEIERATRKPTADLTAYDLYLRAMPGLYARTPAGHDAAKRFLEEAVERDPGFARARSWLSALLASGIFAGWEPDNEAARGRAINLAREALASDSADPLVLARSGFVLTMHAGMHAEGSALLDRAIAANQNCVEALTRGGWVAVFSGDFETALSRVALSERLDPLSPDPVTSLSLRAAAYFSLRQFDAAIEAAKGAIGRAPDFSIARAYLIASLAHAGREEEARAQVADLFSRNRQWALARVTHLSPYREKWMTELLIDGLRLAGAPAT